MQSPKGPKPRPAINIEASDERFAITPMEMYGADALRRGARPGERPMTAFANHGAMSRGIQSKQGVIPRVEAPCPAPPPRSFSGYCGSQQTGGCFAARLLQRLS